LSVITLRKHIDAHFDEELFRVKERLAIMGRLVELQVRSAITAFLQRDAKRAAAVAEGDREVNQLERDIDEHCVRTLALRQPAGSDLRFVAATLKIVTDLERIGDLAVSTARQSRSRDDVSLQALHSLSELAETALTTLRTSLDCFLQGDAVRARTVIAANGQMAEEVACLAAGLGAEMTREPALIANGLAALMVAKHIERMFAHATNIAEMTIYTTSAQDVRHIT
jgi:phosphate transport system protein